MILTHAYLVASLRKLDEARVKAMVALMDAGQTFGQARLATRPVKVAEVVNV